MKMRLSLVGTAAQLVKKSLQNFFACGYETPHGIIKDQTFLPVT